MSARVVTESDKGNQFTLTVFSKLLLFAKVPFNTSEVNALYVHFACQFGSIGVTLHLSSRLGSPLQSFLYNFRLDYDWQQYTVKCSPQQQTISHKHARS